MCGIIGMFDVTTGGLFSSDDKPFFDMLLLNSLRGADSTGLMGIDPRKNLVDTVKAVGSPYDLVMWEASQRFMKRIGSKYYGVIGHGRAATVGSVKAQNAHPFKHGNITMVHNGTLRNYEALKKRHNIEFEVDSEAICYLINHLGINETIKEIEGAYAMVWYNLETKKVYILRNHERPLKYILGTKKNRLIFASEEHVALAGILREYNPSYMKSQDFTAMKLYSFGFETNEIKFEEEDLYPLVRTPGYTHHYTRGSYSATNTHHTTNNVVTLPAKNSTSVTQTPMYKRGNTTVCVGEDIHFFLDDAQELSNVQDQEGNPIVAVEGHHVDDPGIKVNANFQGKFSEIEDKLKGDKSSLTLCARVVKISVTSSVMGCRIFAEEAEFVASEPETTSKSKSKKEEVKLKYTQLDKDVWERLKTKGCIECGAALIRNLAPYYAYRYAHNGGYEGILCQTCTAKHEELDENAFKRALN